MTMRCKVYCSQKVPYEDTSQISFSAVVDGSEENKAFFKYTPGGQMNFNVVSKEVSDQFTIGKQYYVDIFEAT